MASKYRRIQILLELAVPEWKYQEMIRELSRDQVKKHLTDLIF